MIRISRQSICIMIFSANYKNLRGTTRQLSEQAAASRASVTISDYSVIKQKSN